MNAFVTLLSVLVISALALTATPTSAEFQVGTPEILSMGSLEFGPEGVLYIGDSKGGRIFAIDTGDVTTGDRTERFAVNDIETKVGALLGTTAEDVLIHDLAVNPISRKIYLSASRGRANWDSKWFRPNDLADANVLLSVNTDDSIEAVSLENVRYDSMELPNPVDMSKTHRWKEGLSQRVDAITRLVVHEGKLYVSGLSNEEFAATLWHVDLPFGGETHWTTLEIFHGAHGEWETYAPIRAFLPYQFGEADYVLASYLCTPLVTFPVADLLGGKHVKGHTIAELGSGNYPVDLLEAKHEGESFFVMSNTQLPLMTFATTDIQEYMNRPGITRESPTYAEGVPYTPRAGSGVLQMDNFNDDFLVALQRLPSGKLDLVALSVARLAL